LFSSSTAAAAVRVSVRLVLHSVVQNRATGTVRGGALRELQRVYRQRRPAAAGTAFPSDADALGRVQEALISTPARARFREVMRAVFG
jgi:hypothetical protein